MPNLILMEGYTNSLPILNAIFEAKRKELPIGDHALFRDVFLIAFAAFAKDIAI
jgi:hypothetical protein